MTALESDSKSGTRTWSWRPRFGLASLLALVTLAAIGSWYWWRRPFEVERKGLDRSLGMEREILWAVWPPDFPEVDSFADPFFVGPPSSRKLPAETSGTQQSSKQSPKLFERRSVIVREVETVRRLWGGMTIRVGGVIGYDEDGRKIAESHYREGLLHGPSVTWFRDGHIREQGEYLAGKKEGPWVRYFQHVQREPLRIVLAKTVAVWKSGVPDGSWEWFDAQGKSLYTASFANGRLIGPPPDAFDRGLGQYLVDGKIDDPNLQLTLLSPCSIEFVETPLHDAIVFLAERHETPIRLDAKRIEESGVNIDAPVSLTIQEGPPLIECLARILAPMRLVCDYRHGLLTITTPRGIASVDTSGVSQIRVPLDSPLASVWNRSVTVELIETPFTQALGLMEKQVGLEGLFVFDDVPSGLRDAPVTMVVKQHPFSLVLGLMLENMSCRASLKEGNVIVISNELIDQGAVTH